MSLIAEKFDRLAADGAPGQEGRQKVELDNVPFEKLDGTPVDFSHGDVDAFTPPPGSLERFNEAVHIGGEQAYTEYRGGLDIRENVAGKISNFTGARIDPIDNFIITPGTQGALFLAVGSTVTRGDKVAIVEPDYFANRKLVEFFEGDLTPVQMDFLGTKDRAGLDLNQLENVFQQGVKVFLFSNPNNPAGVIYSNAEVRAIGELADKYGVTVIVDQLYSRQLFEGRDYTHLVAEDLVDQENIITIMGPSKTESLSGYRLGVGFGSATIIERMERLQAIVSLRAAGYNQAVLKTWFDEPEGWLEDRILKHQAIRDDLVNQFRNAEFIVRPAEAGSYIFPKVPNLSISIQDFIKVLRLYAGVTVTPGTQFGPQFTDHFRINFSQDHRAAVEAIDRVIQVAEKYRI
jgi:aspartate/methionine/tyrosine aminotransferase